MYSLVLCKDIYMYLTHLITLQFFWGIIPGFFKSMNWRNWYVIKSGLKRMFSDCKGIFISPNWKYLKKTASHQYARKVVVMFGNYAFSPLITWQSPSISVLIVTPTPTFLGWDKWNFQDIVTGKRFQKQNLGGLLFVCLCFAPVSIELYHGWYSGQENSEHIWICEDCCVKN